MQETFTQYISVLVEVMWSYRYNTSMQSGLHTYSQVSNNKPFSMLISTLNAL